MVSQVLDIMKKFFFSSFVFGGATQRPLSAVKIDHYLNAPGMR